MAVSPEIRVRTSIANGLLLWGYTFFLQVHYDRYSNAGSEKEVSDGESSSASSGEDR